MIVYGPDATYCHADAEGVWRQIHPPIKKVFAFHSTRAGLFAFSRSNRLLTIAPRTCDFQEVSAPPGSVFLGSAGWNDLSVLTEVGLFCLHHDHWIKDKEFEYKVGEYSHEYERSLVGADDVMALYLPNYGG